ncbi:MAG: DUF1846 domain-containing protein [Clostridia bacterium]|nr:DUF1846 domain-containing protein [Clostridia bacterium]MBQ5488324.1 DUF1846 domain-containing protein [Clostridia bacterium]MBR4635790.1 DUF1846 domain-containing protein [Clostridia bacterium]
MKIGFDNERYIRMQSQKILERISHFGDKLYLEFGGKLFDDYHASRVVPGFQPDTKINMLLELRDSAEIILAIHSGDIERNKIRSDIDIAYDREVLRLIDAFSKRGLLVSGVVITRYREGQPAVDAFAERLRRLGVRVYHHYPIEGYPQNPKFIVSDEGFGRNEFVETTRPLVIVTAPGPGSGKLAVCLSQIYQEFRRGVRAGYAKFETFPVWNLPLTHPVNLAYEAATIDLDDMNMIDPFHLQAYSITTVNYNRDIESFPVLNTMFTHIYGESPYKSPTDMGVNMIGNCITDNEVVCAAANQEIIRRYYQTACAFKRGRASKEQVYKAEFIMSRAGLTVEDRPVVAAALKRAEDTGAPAMAIELPDGSMITGKTGEFVGPAAGALVNALKALAGISKDIDLISPIILRPIRELKTMHFGSENPLLHSDELLYALSICAATNPTAARAMEQLPKLRGCEAHSSVMLSVADRSVYRKLGLNCTNEPILSGNRFYL